MRLRQFFQARFGASLRLRQVALRIGDLLYNRLQLTKVARFGNISVGVVNGGGKRLCLARCKNFLEAVGQIFNA